MPGNHEYYQAKELKLLDQIDTIDNVMRLACEEAKVIFLNCDQWMDPKTGIEVVGCTLWSLVSGKTWSKMNDHQVFSSVDKCVEVHGNHALWLTKALQKPSEHPRIVITHHLPSFDLIPLKFALSEINDGFCSNLNHLFQKSQSNLQAWIFGHTHERVDKEINGIRMLCNPFGYPGEKRETNFSFESVIISYS